MRADRLLAENISTLLRARGQSQKDLAAWCRHSDVWVSQGLRGERMFQLHDLDRIADFFGVATYQLFQPGISMITERRRKADRRSGQDRRLSQAQRVMREVANEIDRARPVRKRDRRRKPIENADATRKDED